MFRFVRPVPDSDIHGRQRCPAGAGVAGENRVIVAGSTGMLFCRHVMLVLLLAAVAAGCAQASTTPSISAPLPADALPVPPPRPAQPPLQGFAPAPVPDPDLQRPRSDQLAEQPRTGVMPRLFTPPDRRSGEGYVQGSAGEYGPERRLRASPSLIIRVPLP